MIVPPPGFHLPVERHRPEHLSSKTDKDNRLASQQEFRIVAGIRDMIRQQVLENMRDKCPQERGRDFYHELARRTLV